MRRSSGRRGPRGSFSGRRNRPRWTAVIDTYSLAPATTDETIIVAPADYRTATSLENDATFLRLRGSLQVANTSLTLGCTVCLALIKLNNVTGVVFNPSLQADLQNGEILWSNIVTLQALASTNHLSSFRFDNIDVSVKRRLSALPEGDDIRMVIHNVVGGGTIFVAFMARALIELKA